MLRFLIFICFSELFTKNEMCKTNLKSRGEVLQISSGRNFCCLRAGKGNRSCFHRLIWPERIRWSDTHVCKNLCWGRRVLWGATITEENRKKRTEVVGWRVIREKYVWRNKRTSCNVKQGQFVPTELWFYSIFALQRRMAERPEQAWQEGWEEAIGLHSQDFQRRRLQWLLMVKWWKAADTKGHPREILREKLPQQDKTSFINRSEGEGISGTAEEETYWKSTWSPNFSANTEQKHQ